MLVMGVSPYLWLRTIENRIGTSTLIGKRPACTIPARSRGGSAVTQVPDIYRILPELVLTLTGVLVMLTDASLAPVDLAAVWAG